MRVFGYTLVNDVSARDLQWRAIADVLRQGPGHLLPHRPVDRRPCVPRRRRRSGLHIGARVNGEDRQSDSTSELIFGVARIVVGALEGNHAGARGPDRDRDARRLRLPDGADAVPRTGRRGRDLGRGNRQPREPGSGMGESRDEGHGQALLDGQSGRRERTHDGDRSRGARSAHDHRRHRQDRGQRRRQRLHARAGHDRGVGAIAQATGETPARWRSASRWSGRAARKGCCRRT